MIQAPDSARTSDHLPYLDGWRGIAILLVLLAHFGQVYRVGMLGVQVFFVLSGLLMSRLLFEQRMPLRTFYRRRVARIFPVFYLYLIAVAAWQLAYPSLEVPASSLGWAALFLRTYLPGSDISADAAIGHLWSLNVEEHAYIAMSLIALVTARRCGHSGLFGLTALSGSVPTYVQIRLSAGGGHGRRLIVETNLARQGPDCHDHHCEG